MSQYKKILCVKCNREFDAVQFIDGNRIKMYDRQMCLECKPYLNRKQRIKLYNKPLTTIQQQIFDGHLLGDGYLTNLKWGRNSSFRLTRVSTDFKYLEWSANYFANYLAEKPLVSRERFDNRTKKIYYCSEMFTKALPIFTEQYHKWYPEGKKIVPKDFILTPLALAVWIADDGNFYQNFECTQLTIATDSFDYESVDFLYRQLVDLYGDTINMPNNNEVWRIRISTSKTIFQIIDDIKDVFPLERKLQSLERRG